MGRVGFRGGIGLELCFFDRNVIPGSAIDVDPCLTWQNHGRIVI